MADAWLVRLSPQDVQAAVPGTGDTWRRACACCGAPPVRTMRERRPFDVMGAGVLLVPYCAACHRHASAETTRVLALSISTALVAVTLTAGLPLVFQPSSVFVYAALVVLGTSIPVAASRIAFSRRTRSAEGHSTAGRAVYFRLDGVLVCRSEGWASALAGNGPVAKETESGALLAPWAAAVVAACFLSLWPWYRFHFPVVRVVNASGDTLTLKIDGVDRGRVPSTARESELAGVELRVPAGRRLFQAFDVQHRQVDSSWVAVEGGGIHLYAPSSSGVCFRIETTGFGRSRAPGTTTYPLVGPPYFWVLPSGSSGDGGIDYWFSAAPPPSEDTRSSGGVVRALRQSPCSGVR